MLKKAPPVPLAEGAAYLAPFAPPFKRSEGRESLERHVTGVLAELDCKSGGQLAWAVAGTGSQRVQALLTELPRDGSAVNAPRVQQLSRAAGAGEGALIADDTGVPEQGTASAGVARQYPGALGKVANGQGAVSAHYADARSSWPVGVRLYLPESWAQDPARRQRAQVPADVTVATKPEIAVRLVEGADRWGGPMRRSRPAVPTAGICRFWRRWSGARSALGPRALRTLGSRGPPGRVARSSGPRPPGAACPRGRGNRSPGGRAAGAVCARRLSGCAAGGPAPRAGAPRAGCSASGPGGGRRGPGSTISVTRAPRPASNPWCALPTSATTASRSTQEPRGSWAGIRTRGGSGTAFIALPC